MKKCTDSTIELWGGGRHGKSRSEIKLTKTSKQNQKQARKNYSRFESNAALCKMIP
jgi:hypothetical protein